MNSIFPLFDSDIAPCNEHKSNEFGKFVENKSATGCCEKCKYYKEDGFHDACKACQNGRIPDNSYYQK